MRAAQISDEETGMIINLQSIPTPVFNGIITLPVTSNTLMLQFFLTLKIVFSVFLNEQAWKQVSLVQFCHITTHFFFSLPRKKRKKNCTNGNVFVKRVSGRCGGKAVKCACRRILPCCCCIKDGEAAPGSVCVGHLVSEGLGVTGLSAQHTLAHTQPSQYTLTCSRSFEPVLV